MRIQGLDVIRGIAISLVLLRHSWPETFGGAGIVGVVVFFALSGYLITGLLLNDIEARGRVRFKRFYMHRLFRLVPPLLVVLAAIAVVSLIWNPLDDRSDLVRSMLVGLTYTADLPGFEKGSPAIGHLWTLAIEEQFYLAWPTILLLAVRWKRVALVVGAVLVGSYLVIVATVVVAAPDVDRLYTLPTSWAIVMVIGAAARIWQDRVASALNGRGKFTMPFAAAGLGALALAPEIKGQALTYLAYGPLIGFATVAMIFAMRGWVTVPRPALLPLLWLGQISYAAYLWNLPIQQWLGAASDFTAADRVVLLVATIAVATLSYWTVERWAGRARSRLDNRKLAAIR